MGANWTRTVRRAGMRRKTGISVAWGDMEVKEFGMGREMGLRLCFMCVGRDLRRKLQGQDNFR